MTTTIEDHLVDTRLSTLWLWGEFIGVILILCLIIIVISVRRGHRMITSNRFKKSRILITNGTSLLSRELHHQLTARHQCQVVLLSDCKGISTVAKFDLTNGNVVNLNCDMLCHQQMNTLVEYVWNELGSVDAIIDIEEEVQSGDVCDVVQQTGTNIQRFLNLVGNFAPKMHQSGGGQIVTVRSNINAAGACISSRDDVQNMLQLLTHSQATNFIANIQLTTVFLNRQGRAFDVGDLMQYLGITPELTLTEVADRIIKGLQTGRDNIEIKSRRSLIDFTIRKLKKQDNTEFEHQHSNISTSLRNCQ
ncbi:uncharacterized protein LOC132263119 [Phlebotomus argentipes]|uniref:uncharacterized protein LOC132263119 n=1 Tax=Phlebotomus argentipes TaxID=94469 RepID=UPI002893669C|nr:uncharacterized protein LOC132263119 [Phlebotomus argentipes]XP_059618690.1 uncharacterized protein LOC132263119 [Phlebotomus argentipes]XP_059618691.1 uncharacterized protein LOC132263119 [Phlebotomus argentipes]XP_059618692.1 uncharacterized protein LOC132263119 [Phlebotomus argentipes]